MKRLTEFWIARLLEKVWRKVTESCRISVYNNESKLIHFSHCLLCLPLPTFSSLVSFLNNYTCFLKALKYQPSKAAQNVCVFSPSCYHYYEVFWTWVFIKNMIFLLFLAVQITKVEIWMKWLFLHLNLIFWISPVLTEIFHQSM